MPVRDMPAEAPQPMASSSTSQITIPVSITLETLEEDTMDPTWYEALKGEFSKPYFKQVCELRALWERPLTCLEVEAIPCD